MQGKATSLKIKILAYRWKVEGDRQVSKSPQDHIPEAIPLVLGVIPHVLKMIPHVPEAIPYVPKMFPPVPEAAFG